MKRGLFFLVPLLAGLTGMGSQPERIWSRIWGSTGNDVGYAVATHGTNVYVSGYAEGSFGGLTYTGADDLFLSVYSESGEHVWSRLWGTTHDEQVHDICVDPDGSVYAVGDTWGYLDGQQNAGESDFFLTRLTPAGATTWTRLWGSTSFSEGQSVARDVQGNLYVCGHLKGSVEGAQPAIGGRDLCLTKYTSAGVQAWTRQWGSSSDDYAMGVAIDSMGSVYVAGYTTASFDGQSFFGAYDPFLTKYSSSGSRLWTRIWGASDADYAYGITIDDADNVYVVGSGGSFHGRIPVGARDVFVSVFTTDGTWKWTTMWGSTDHDAGYAIDHDSQGSVYITGHAGAMVFDGQPGTGGLFLSKLLPSGARLWTQRWGALGSVGRAITVTAPDTLYVAGQTQDKFDGQNTFGGIDFCVTRFAPPSAPTITTAPYVDSIGATTATVHWTTSYETDSLVRYGRYVDGWEGEVSVNGERTTHGVVLTGLRPDSTYRYEAESTDLYGRSVTSPVSFFTTLTPTGGGGLSSQMLMEGDLPLRLIADATGDVDRIEILINNQLVGITYCDAGEWTIPSTHPALQEGNNVISATAFGADGGMRGFMMDNWFTSNTGMATRVEIEDPWSGCVIYTTGTNAPATNILLRVLAARSTTTLVGTGHFGPYGSASDQMQRDWSSVTNVRFYINGDLVHTSPMPVPDPTGDNLYHEFSYDITGLSTGAYRFMATFTPPENYRTSWDTRTFRIEQREAELFSYRDVDPSPSTNALIVSLSIRNRGSGAATLGTIRDTLTGFQICRVTSPWGDIDPEVTFSWQDRASTLRLVGAGHQQIPPETTATITYYAIPILFPEDPGYQIGGNGEFTGVNAVTAAPITLPFDRVTTTVGPFASRIALVDAVARAKRAADYLLVSCPVALHDVYGRENSGQILAKMGELATYRQGVLGYFHAANWTRTSYRSGDPIDLGYTFKEWNRSDQVWVGDVSDDRLRAYSRVAHVSNGDIPMPRPWDIRAGDAIAVGDFLPWDITGTNRHERREVALAYGDGHGVIASRIEVAKYKHDPAESVFTVATEYVSGYATGGAMVAGKFAFGRPQELAAVIQPDGQVRMYEFWEGGGYSVVSFGTAYQPGDPVAAGNLLGDESDELVIADINADRLRVYGKAPGSTEPYPALLPQKSVTKTLEPGDDIAVGDVLGDGRDELIVADASTDRIRIYSYDPPHDRFVLAEEVDWHFNDGDALLAGRVGTLLKDQIIVARGTEHDGVEAGVLEMFRPLAGDTPGDRYALDALLDRDGDWAVQLAPGWDTDGHLLLVGETEIVPAFRSVWNVYLNASHHDKAVNFHDRDYADTYSSVDKPELACGRIIGNTTARILQTMQTSIDLATGASRLEVGSALAVAGNEDGADWCRPVRNRIRDKLTSKGFTVETCSNDGASNVFTRAINRDNIFFSGHGNVDVWDGLYSSDIDAFYECGSGHPVVYADSCLTGRYPDGYSFAEAFLANGASAYIGATEVTVRYRYDGKGWGPRFGDAIYDRIRSDYTIGQTVKNAKRHRMSDSANTYSWDWNLNRYHCATYHLYGDPKISYEWTTPALAGYATALAKEESADITGPLSELNIQVPAPVVIPVTNGWNYIEIPGEGELAIEGYPIVPIHTTSVAFPSNCVVQTIALVSQSQAQTYQGLNPITCETRLNASGSTIPAPHAVQDEWPDRVYDWSLEEDGTGSNLLHVTVYPFYHNSKSGLSSFYNKCTFAIDYTWSDVELRGLMTDRHTYTNGADMVADVYLYTSNPTPRDVVLQPEVLCDLNGQTTLLPIRLLREFRGWAHYRMHWTVASSNDGPHILKVAVLHDGVILDRGETAFEIGGAAAALGGFSVSPTEFGIGDSVTYGVTLDNSGSLTIDGSLYVLLQNAAGETVAQFKKDFGGLAPGGSLPMQCVWQYASLLPRNCRVIVYAVYGGQTSALQIAHDGTTLPFFIDDFSRPNGLLDIHWPSLDGRRYRIEMTTNLHSTFTPIVTDIPASPPYNSFSVGDTPREAFYRVIEVEEGL